MPTFVVIWGYCRVLTIARSSEYTNQSVRLVNVNLSSGSAAFLFALSSTWKVLYRSNNLMLISIVSIAE